MKRTFIIREREHAESLARFLAANWQAMAQAGEPMQVTCAPYKASRTNDQLAVMWAGILQPLAEQAWVNGARYSAETWHEFLKRTIMQEMKEDEDAERWFKASAELWRYMPDGSREFSGSTGMLTKRGMGEYLTRIEAYVVTEHGVRLQARPGEL